MLLTLQYVFHLILDLLTWSLCTYIFSWRNMALVHFLLRKCSHKEIDRVWSLQVLVGSSVIKIDRIKEITICTS